jgi:hypothetical protein
MVDLQRKLESWKAWEARGEISGLSGFLDPAHAAYAGFKQTELLHGFGVFTTATT